MNKRQFVQQRTPAWERFEELSSHSSKLRQRELVEFSRLFREVSSDLALVRSRNWGQALESYLNHLVGQGHNRYYSHPAGNLQQFLRFIAVGYPRLFRKHIDYFVVAAALFFVPGAISWAVVQNNPSLASRIIDAEMLGKMDEMYDHDPDDPEREGFSESRAAMGGFYVRNNVGIALRCFAIGIFFGGLTVYVLLTNGIVIGAVAGYIISQGHGKAFTSFVISHGSFELTAIAVAGGAGLMLGRALVHSGQRTRLESLRHLGLESVQIASGAGVMLMVAAVIEAFWSPSGVPSILKYIVGSALWVLVILYLSLSGRESRAGGVQ